MLRYIRSVSIDDERTKDMLPTAPRPLPSPEALRQQILRNKELPLSPALRQVIAEGSVSEKDIIRSLETASRVRRTPAGTIRIMSGDTDTNIEIDSEHVILRFDYGNDGYNRVDAGQWLRKLTRDYVAIPDYVRHVFDADLELSDGVHHSIDRGYFDEGFIRDAVSQSLRARRTLRGGIVLETPYGELSLSLELVITGIDQTILPVDEELTVEEMKDVLRDTAWHRINAAPTDAPALEDPERDPEGLTRTVSLPKLPGQKTKRRTLPTTVSGVIELLESKGYTCRNDSGHYHVTREGSSETLVMGSTPSDHRWVDNMASTFRKLFHEDLRD